jgi:hypothetical protein
MLRRIGNLLSGCYDNNAPFYATELFNEKWLLRLCLDLIKCYGITLRSICFLEDAKWFSEASIQSPFKKRKQKDQNGEPVTRADGVIGHIAIADGCKTKIELANAATQINVIEAKMYSYLRKKVKNAENYDQATRSIGCIYQLLASSNMQMENMKQVAYTIICPVETYMVNKVGLDRDKVASELHSRAIAYGNGETWMENGMNQLISQIRLECITWEEIIDSIKNRNSDEGSRLEEFYSKCKQFNKPVKA